jgi:hypothetical protein
MLTPTHDTFTWHSSYLPSLLHHQCMCCVAVVQGCTVAYAMLAAMPEMNDKVSVVAHMGPVVSAGNCCYCKL